MLAATMAVVTDVGRRRKDDKLPEEKTRPTELERQIAESWQRFQRGLWLSGLRISEAVNLSWNSWPKWGIRGRAQK